MGKRLLGSHSLGLRCDVEPRDRAIITKFRTDQRHSRGNGNPWVARLSRWIPACAGMTDQGLMDHGCGYRTGNFPGFYSPLNSSELSLINTQVF